MEWKLVNPLTSKESIAELESITGFSLPEAFVLLVKQFNGGRPMQRNFDTEKTKGRMIKGILSFNSEDVVNIFQAQGWIGEDNDSYVPFAIDLFGNLICFEKSSRSFIL